ncbi:hypothetical protein TWF506_010583 [Arthrobotrys conoides]|uniref:LYR motif-containing protein 2 n=1 Tax=Arthrobotrys conoides TaxID=74498 RepID=A0AAN8N909_9PEZI
MPPVDLVLSWDWIGYVPEPPFPRQHCISMEKIHVSTASLVFPDRCIDMQWIQRSRVLALWREILRTVRHIEDPATREEMRSWARHEFKRNKNVEEMTQIRYLISQGRHEMETISQSIGYSFKG